MDIWGTLLSLNLRLLSVSCNDAQMLINFRTLTVLESNQSTCFCCFLYWQCLLIVQKKKLRHSFTRRLEKINFILVHQIIWKKVGIPRDLPLVSRYICASTIYTLHFLTKYLLYNSWNSKKGVQKSWTIFPSIQYIGNQTCCIKKKLHCRYISRCGLNIQ